jgi:GNAT superfamily N-acetyltransferase
MSSSPIGFSDHRDAHATSDTRFTVRPAVLPDAAVIARLSGELGYPSSPEQVKERLAGLQSHPEHAVLVAEAQVSPSESHVVGWVHAYVERTLESNPTVELGGLVVEETWRGSGIGRLLMGQVECWARATGCETVTVRSNVVRERAHAFYQRLGFGLVKTQDVFRKSVRG